MTADKEEVIDFVAPYFEQTGITIGGGEAPKALSGRTLVAAYWLFVVLMLATFTANLAAFLTVERMQEEMPAIPERLDQDHQDSLLAHQQLQDQKGENMDTTTPPT
ncbi:unnamed protein product [Phaedon cochleariae]|uniref:Ionotropic glutamate receptor C-terminal domain-containing protein n=1 Tax=Phaedon cochleariae TaxID=80249 RepID=A0A9N9SLS4_PHACE|nr:unnamed protein product [Phaedon cochleariae]